MEIWDVQSQNGEAIFSSHRNTYPDLGLISHNITIKYFLYLGLDPRTWIRIQGSSSILRIITFFFFFLWLHWRFSNSHTNFSYTLGIVGLWTFDNMINSMVMRIQIFKLFRIFKKISFIGSTNPHFHGFEKQYPKAFGCQTLLEFSHQIPCFFRPELGPRLGSYHRSKFKSKPNINDLYQMGDGSSLLKGYLNLDAP